MSRKFSKNIETFIGCDSEYESAQAAVFGAPFDSTTSFRPGARFASRAMRADSWGLETYSPFQDKDLADSRIFDCGDLELPFGGPEAALAQVENISARILADKKIPLMLGGEHLLTLGAVRAAVKQYPDLRIVHFDAHADLRDEYLGVKLSHACVLRRCWDLVGDDKIFQFGIRSGDKSEFVWGREHVFTNKFNFNGLKENLKFLELNKSPVYFTLDLDVLDPSVFPGTGTPEPGGVSFMELLEAAIHVCGLNIIGCDINELSPHYDQSGASTAAACKILREMLIALTQKL
ncbi:MAG: agmatinase [Oscillospiraceae bacterium]|jgi:agmatinase|nr:agmatinase [Oscillospiraceae bacterium]